MTMKPQADNVVVEKNLASKDSKSKEITATSLKEAKKNLDNSNMTTSIHPTHTKT